MRLLAHTPPAWPLALVCALTLAACGGGSDARPSPATDTLAIPSLGFTAPGESLDLANYTLVGQYGLSVGSGANLLAGEVSAVTWNQDTDTLFIVGDNGTSVTQIGKTGQLIDTMTLPADATKPQGTYYYDPEGIAYIGGGQFVLSEERYRQVTRFTYAAGTTLDPATAQTVKLGTTIGNTGFEGISFDPVTGGYIIVKEKTPLGIFQTGIDFTADTATNGSPTATGSTNLFDPALADAVADFGDVYALSNVLPIGAADREHLMVLSQESGRILKMDRSGQVLGTLAIEVAAQHEGITFDAQLNMYVTNELGAGGSRGEQLWVYAPTRSAAAVGLGSHLYLTFDKPVVAGSGNLVLSNGAGDVRSIAVTDTSQVSFRSATVVINPAADLLPGCAYSVQYASGVVQGAAGETAAAVNTASALAFTTVSDITVPQLLSSTPGDGALSVTGSRLVLSFDETVKAGTGTVTISDGASDVRVINAADTTQVTISGSTVDINPSADLAPGTAYHLLVSGSAFTDLAGNPYVGWSNPAQLNFNTASSAVPTVLNAGDILFIGANAAAPDAFAFVLLRDINAGTSILFSDRDALNATNESAFQWVADVAYPVGTIVTIQPDQSSGIAPVANLGHTLGKGGGLGKSDETVFAFQGSIANLSNTSAGELSPLRYIAAINLGVASPLDATLHTALDAAGAFIAHAADNALFAGSLATTDLPALRARIANTANWSTNDSATGFAITNNSLFP